jgi:nucleoside-diphosphate-sugar epimerase
MRAMRYLVTGGAGFIGSHLVDRLAAEGAEQVIVLDNLHRGRRSNLAKHESNPVVQFVEGDIRDASLMRDQCDGVDIIFHLAAQSNVMGASGNPVYSLETNVVGTVNVLDAAHSAGVRRFVFASSREVYGEPKSLPVSEETEIAPKNLYGASKASGEMYCRAYRERGLDVRIVRLANVYGPRDTDRVIPLWIGRARQGLPLDVFGGAQVIDFVWVEDAVEALIRASNSESCPGPLNIGSGHGTPIKELARLILEQTQSASPLRVLPARAEEVVGFVADISAMRVCLGMEPPLQALHQLPAIAQDVGF